MILMIKFCLFLGQICYLLTSSWGKLLRQLKEGLVYVQFPAPELLRRVRLCEKKKNAASRVNTLWTQLSGVCCEQTFPRLYQWRNYLSPNSKKTNSTAPESCWIFKAKPLARQILLKTQNVKKFKSNWRTHFAGIVVITEKQRDGKTDRHICLFPKTPLEFFS